jgi:hypothetical protein
MSTALGNASKRWASGGRFSRSLYVGTTTRVLFMLLTRRQVSELSPENKGELRLPTSGGTRKPGADSIGFQPARKPVASSPGVA